MFAPPLPQNPSKTPAALGPRWCSHGAPPLPQGVLLRIQILRPSHGSVRCGAMRGRGEGYLADLVGSIFGSPGNLGDKAESRRKNLKQALYRLEEHRSSLMEATQMIDEVNTHVKETICKMEALQSLIDELLPEIERLEQKIEVSQDPIVVLLQRIRKLNLAFPRQPNNSSAVDPLKTDFDLSDSGVGSVSIQSAIMRRIFHLNLFFLLKKDKVNYLEEKVKEFYGRLGLSSQMEKPHLLEELDKKLIEAMNEKEFQEYLNSLFHEIKMLNQDLTNCEDERWHDFVDVLSHNLDELEEILSSQPAGSLSGVIVPIITDFIKPGFKSGEVPEVKSEIVGEHGEAKVEMGQLPRSGVAEMGRYHDEGFGNIIGMVKSWVEARLWGKGSSTFYGTHELHSLAHHLGNDLWVLPDKTKGPCLQTCYNLIIDLEEDVEATFLEVEEFFITREGFSSACEELRAKVNELVIRREALLGSVKSLLQETIEVKKSLSSYYADKTLQDFPDSAQKSDEDLQHLMGSSYQKMDTNGDLEPAGHAF